MSALPRIRGGLRLARDKPGLDKEILDLPMPPRLVFPLLGYGATPLAAEVAVGQRVARGGRLADGLYASAAGTVVAIEPRPVMHPSRASAPCIVLDTTGTSTSGAVGVAGAAPVTDASVIADESAASATTTPAPSNRRVTNRSFAYDTAGFIDRVRRAGIGGMGGAGYPAADKLEAVTGALELLVVNAAECEPGIACDEALVTADARGVVAGLTALIRHLEPARTIVAIEADKLAAIDQLRAELTTAGFGAAATHRDPAANDRADRDGVALMVVEPIYPSGAERPLLELACGHRLPHDRRPSEIGMLCLNVATVHAIGLAMANTPAFTRIVTVAGDAAESPRQVRVLFGTPVAHVLAASGNSRTEGARLRIGGPLSGFDIDSSEAAVTATANRIALETPRVPEAGAPCIRCGDCADVCPVDLLPQQLHWHARGENLEALGRFGLARCIECACCDLVCPSSIALTASFRHAKGLVQLESSRSADSARAQASSAARDERLRRLARGEARASSPGPLPVPTRARPTPDNAAVADAVARARELAEARTRAAATGRGVDKGGVRGAGRGPGE